MNSIKVKQLMHIYLVLSPIHFSLCKVLKSRLGLGPRTYSFLTSQGRCLYLEAGWAEEACGGTLSDYLGVNRPQNLTVEKSVSE